MTPRRRSTPLRLGLVGSLAVGAIPIAQALQQDDAGGLRPIQPEGRSGEETEAPQGAGSMFDPQPWVARLTDADLDRREMTFEDALRTARTTPELRRWIESAAGGADELAWTARLLLRELDAEAAAPRDPLEALLRGDGWRSRHPFGSDPFGGRGSLFEMFEDLLQGRPSSPPGASGLNFFDSGVQMKVTPDGVEVEVRERAEDGSESVRTYRADSWDELLEAHPELRERIGPRTGGLVPRQPGPAGRELRTDLLGVRVAPIAAPDGTPAGLRVYGTELGTIAQLLRVRPGSVLVSLNGKELLEVEDISRALAARPAGGEIRLRWIEPNGVQTERVWRPNGGEAF